jgi:hypothetical protein
MHPRHDGTDDAATYHRDAETQQQSNSPDRTDDPVGLLVGH